VRPASNRRELTGRGFESRPPLSKNPAMPSLPDSPRTIALGLLALSGVALAAFAVAYLLDHASR
jgi:hypothetical protein